MKFDDKQRPMSKDNQSSVKSGNVNSSSEYKKVLGGEPPRKDVKEIDRQNSPQGRKRAPGSVRV